jgi:type I restriction enzyme S subunit
VISHAVTKGLNSHAPLKDSGIAWLGQVPAHWVVSGISWFFRAEKGKNGQMLTKEYCGQNPGPHPVYSGQTENEGIMGRIQNYEFDTGENGVLFSTTVGAKAMHLSHLKGRFSLSQNCMIIWPDTRFFATRFSYYHFQPSFAYQRALIPEHMQASFRIEDLYTYKAARPPIEEQITIAEYLDKKLLEFDRLAERAEETITLLQERRTALISAAVTGKIDVRHWQPPA